MTKEKEKLYIEIGAVGLLAALFVYILYHMLSTPSAPAATAGQLLAGDVNALDGGSNNLDGSQTNATGGGFGGRIRRHLHQRRRRRHHKK
jgi:hypothetical protein